MKLTTKKKKTIAIGAIVLIVLAIVVYALDRAQKSKAGENIGPGTPGNETNPPGDTGPATKEAVIQDYIENNIKGYRPWYDNVKAKAVKNGIPLKEQLRLDAIYMLKKEGRPGF